MPTLTLATRASSPYRSPLRSCYLAERSTSFDWYPLCSACPSQPRLTSCRCVDCIGILTRPSAAASTASASSILVCTDLFSSLAFDRSRCNPNVYISHRRPNETTVDLPLQNRSTLTHCTSSLAPSVRLVTLIPSSFINRSRRRSDRSPCRTAEQIQAATNPPQANPKFTF